MTLFSRIWNKHKPRSRLETAFFNEQNLKTHLVEHTRNHKVEGSIKSLDKGLETMQQPSQSKDKPPKISRTDLYLFQMRLLFSKRLEMYSTSSHYVPYQIDAVKSRKKKKGVENK
jgi:hypothetical protein